MATAGEEEFGDFEKVNADEFSQDENCVPREQNLNFAQTTVYARTYINVRDSKHVQVNTGDSATRADAHASFNSLHGTDVDLDPEHGKVVTRRKGFKNGVCIGNIAFGNDAGFHFRIKDTFEYFFGRCVMGFTNRNPASLRGSGILTKELETAKSSEGFVVFAPAMDTCAYPGAVIYFSYANDAVVFRSSKDGASQTFPCPGVFQVMDELWAFIELRGPVKEVEVENNTFHEVCGSIAQVSENLARFGWYHTLGYKGGMVAFTKRPVPQGKPAEFKLVKVNMGSVGHIRVGICTENPDLIRPEDLPQTVISHPTFVSMELGRKEAKRDNVISLVPVGNYVCVVVNHEKQIGIIQSEKSMDKTWPFVEIFGKTKAVEITSSTQTNQCQILEQHLLVPRNLGIPRQMSRVSQVWMDAQVIMNTLKAVADAVVYHLEGGNVVPYWNSAVQSVESTAEYLGMPGYVKMAEIGDSPELLRSELPGLVLSVKNLVSHVDEVKASIGGIDSNTLGPGQRDRFKLLRSIAAGLPNFDLVLPSPRPEPMSPLPSNLLLNLVPLPIDADNITNWYKPIVAKTLLETANKIEAAFQPVEDLVRKLYMFGI